MMSGRCVFPLTGLQIGFGIASQRIFCNLEMIRPTLNWISSGDLQSYLSDLSLFLALESNKFYILVDNQPWKDLGARPAHWWQLMVTKSRLSPFANTKGHKERKGRKEASLKPNATNFERWSSMIDALALAKKRVLLPVKKLRNSLLLSSELHGTLHGFIVFEVTWSYVRGINYSNELQTDTSLAIEAKIMKRWEFDSIAQAAGCISSWFSGKLSEQKRFKEYLDSAIGEVFYDIEDDFPRTVSVDNVEENSGDENPRLLESSSSCSVNSGFRESSVTVEDGNETALQHTPSLIGPCKRQKVTNSVINDHGVEVEVYSKERQSQVENAVEATEYHDVLILFRFNDRNLPFKLKQIIMSDLRLLTLLEAGLPSWVLFLQSYPGFCHIYRPWMCPMARALYVLISAVTVVIGFYDLYKNVPVLKATASRFCGPLFHWIETWEMVSRIKYLGTMLFLHNFQKAVQWFLAVTNSARSFLSFLALPLTKPLMEFLEIFVPLWTTLSKTAKLLFSVIWILFESGANLMVELMNIILLPSWFVITTIFNIAISIFYPIFWVVAKVLYALIRLVLVLANSVAFVLVRILDLLRGIWRSFSSIFRIASATEATVSSSEVSMWRSLWNDLFSQGFRAVRSILNGFVAFFTACNRHRLSIYNHLQDFIQRVDREPESSESSYCRCSGRLAPEGRYPESHVCMCCDVGSDSVAVRKKSK